MRQYSWLETLRRTWRLYQAN